MSAESVTWGVLAWDFPVDGKAGVDCARAKPEPVSTNREMRRHLRRPPMARLRGALPKTQAVESLIKPCPEAGWSITGRNSEGYDSGIEAYSLRRPYRG